MSKNMLPMGSSDVGCAKRRREARFVSDLNRRFAHRAGLTWFRLLLVPTRFAWESVAARLRRVLGMVADKFVTQARQDLLPRKALILIHILLTVFYMRWT